MALNYLLHRHQISLARSHSASSREARAAHRGLAAGYAGRIRTMREGMGVVASVELLRVS